MLLTFPVLLISPVLLPAYVAYGNSITAGWCAGGAGYPPRLAEMNGWEPVDLGLPSVRIEPSHGDVIGGVEINVAALRTNPTHWVDLHTGY